MSGPVKIKPQTSTYDLGPATYLDGTTVRVVLGTATEIDVDEVVPVIGAECAVVVDTVRANLASGVVVSGVTCAPNLGSGTEVVGEFVVPIVGAGAILSGGEVVYNPNSAYTSILSTNGSDEVIVAIGTGASIQAGEVKPVLGSATEISAGEVVPVIGTECAIVADTVRATLGSGAVISGSSVIANLGDTALTVSSNQVVLSRALVPLDLTSPKGVLNPNSLTYSVVSAGSDTYQVSLTGNGSILDGITEGVTLRFDIKDSAGNIIDITSNKWLIRTCVTLVSGSPGPSFIAMAGVKTRPTGTAGEILLAGLCTGSATLQRSIASTNSSNTISNQATLYKVIGNIVPSNLTTGSFRLGTQDIDVLDSSGAFLANTQQAAGADATPSTPELIVFLGYDATTGTNNSITIKVEALALRIA